MLSCEVPPRAGMGPQDVKKKHASEIAEMCQDECTPVRHLAVRTLSKMTDSPEALSRHTAAALRVAV